MATVDDYRRTGCFARGITDRRFMEALRLAASMPGWWREVLEDPGLIIAVRCNELNVYWQGQSLFHVEHVGASLRAWTHAKYLMDPAIKNVVPFDGKGWALPPYSSLLAHDFVPGQTLGKLKKAAEVYSEREKQGVHSVVRQNPDVLDVEVAIPRVDPQPRIDIAALERDGDGVRLVFWEAKLFDNTTSLRARGEGMPPALNQILGYRQAVRDHHECILVSYRQVARNMVEIAEMSRGMRKASPLTVAVAEDPDRLTTGPEPAVGLVVFGFDADQRDGKAWAPHRERLCQALPGRFRAAGNAKNICLSGQESLMPRCPAGFRAAT